MYQFFKLLVDLYEGGVWVRQFPTQLGSSSATDITPKARSAYRMLITSEVKRLESERILPNEADVISVGITSVNFENNLRNIIIKMKIKVLKAMTNIESFK